MTVGEEEDIAGGGAQFCDDAIGAGTDVGGGFAVGGAVAEDFPAGASLVNLGGGLAFVIAVVPFDEVGVGLGDGSEAGQRGRFVWLAGGGW